VILKRLITGLACLATATLAFSYAQSDQADDFDFPPLLPADGSTADTSPTPSVPVTATSASPEPASINPNRIVSNEIKPAEQLFGGDTAELMALIPPAKNTTDFWHIYKTEWDEGDERGYQAFVTAIGRSQCSTLDECIRDPANPYRDLSSEVIYLGDCADMAYFLRAYYAWKNGLPFSYQHVMATSDGSKQDLRYSDAGNIIIDRRVVLEPERSGPIHAPSFLQRIGGEVSTAMFRTHPEPDGSRTHDDFFPVEISRDHVVPGSIAYDVFGHVGLIYEVTKDGRALIVASHPDMSVTRTLYGPNFLRTGPNHGGGIKAWRPIRLVGAKLRNDGTFVGGRIEAASNDGLPGYSLVQYYGNGENPVTDWQNSEFIWQGRMMQYYDYVRYALAAQDHQFDPSYEMRAALQGLCSDVRARRVAVDQAIRDKLHLKDHPGRLPPNIYGTYGTWESYSTPSRDARLKTAFRDLMRVSRQLVADAGPDGDALAAELLHIFDEEEQACRIAYKRMDGSLVRLTLGSVMDRLFDMSFDPYHCPERRWGARGDELATCEETNEKRDWYDAQKYLRNQIDRTYEVSMSFTLDQMRSPLDAPPSRGGLGEAEAPDVDVRTYLASVVAPHPSERRAIASSVDTVSQDGAGGR